MRAVDKLEYQSDQCLGIRTRATVEKGVKEDAKKRNPGLKIKNKICNSETDSLPDRSRLNSNLGEQSNNTLSTKPKIFRHFRKLKRKKIYRPKKHYVSIQIPRKGYFYRSTVHSPRKESPSRALRRMELLIEPKNKSKDEISGLASTSSEVSDLPVEKRVKKKLERIDEGEVPTRQGPEAEAPDPPPSPELLEKLTRAAKDKASSYGFRHMLDNYMLSINSEESGSEGEATLGQKLPVNFEAEENLQTSATEENPTCPNFQKSKNSRRRSSRVGDDISEPFELSSENTLPTDDNQNNCGLQVAFDSLLRPLDSTLGREMPTCRLRNPPLTPLEEESSETTTPEDSSHSAGAPARDSGNSQGEQTLTPEGEPKFEDLPLVDCVTDTDALMSKTNALQIDFDECNSVEEFFEVDESISVLSFVSAESLCLLQVSDSQGPTTPEPEELSTPTCPKKFVSTIRFSEKSERIKKSKSENHIEKLKTGFSGKTRLDFGATFFTPEKPEPLLQDLPDRYERILPFDESEEDVDRPPSEPVGRRKTRPRADKTFFGSSRRCGSRWSPTLPELTDIYRSILRESRKLNRKGPLLAERCFSSHVMSFLKKRLKENQLKKDVLDFSKNFIRTFRPLNWARGNVKKPSQDLKEYVKGFQDILHSNLSVKQIRGLNKMLEKFCDYHEKTHTLLRDITKQEEEMEREFQLPSEQKPVEMGWNEPRREREPYESPEPGITGAPSGEDMPTVTLSPPKDLETVLKILESEVEFSEPATDAKSKLLVTVKLSGKQILVKSLTYFNGDEASLFGKNTERGTSQLIIENMTKCYSDTPLFEKQAKKSSAAEKSKMTVKAANKRKEMTERQGKPKKDKEFQYDRQLPRTQHPIKDLEGKIEKNKKLKSDLLREEEPGVPAAIKIALQDALEGKIYLNDLFLELCKGKLEIEKIIKGNGSIGGRPQAKRRPSSPQKKQRDMIRSHINLKKSASGKTVNLTSARPRYTYFCYPSVTNLHENFDKRTVTDKIKSDCSPSPSVAAAFKEKQTNPKKSFQELEQTNQEQVAEQRQTTATEAASTTGPKEPASEGGPGKTDRSDPSRPDGGATSACWSVELLVTDESASNIPDNAAEKSPPETVTDRDAAASEQLENPPILLHRSRSSADGTSFRSEIIHSDSFLKFCTPLKVTQSKLKSLFKCTSDVKFYPGRVQEDTDDAEPFITFVLTPKQKEGAGVPSDLVKVVQKKLVSEPSPASQDEEQDTPEQGTLQAVEKFIAEMAELRHAAIERQKRAAMERKKQAVIMRQRQAENRKKAPAYSGNCEPKKGVLSQGWNDQSQRPPERKAYHECQKRMLESERRKSPRAGGIPNTARAVYGPRSEPVKKTSGVYKMKDLEIQKADTREAMQDKATETNSSESKVEALVTDVAEWSPEGDGKEEYENASDFSDDILEAIKDAIARVEDFENKEKIIEAMEDVENKQTEKESEATKASSSKPKKSKTLKIKIRCKGMKPSENKEKLAEREGGERQKEGEAAEIALLETLVAKTEEGGALKTCNSTYFDALEKKAEAAEGAADDGGVPQAAGGSVEGGPKPRSQSYTQVPCSRASLTPSDEELLSLASDEKETEELIYRKISEYLQEGNVSHSVSLLDEFLKKTENSSEEKNRRVRLEELLSLIENKSRNLMMSMQKNAWLKVLSLLEEAARVLDDESVQHSKKAQLLEKIQSLNVRNLVDVEKSRASPGNVGIDDGSVNHVLCALGESLSFLRRKIPGKRSRRLEGIHDLDDEAETSESALRIHSAESLAEVRAGNSATKPSTESGHPKNAGGSRIPEKGPGEEKWPSGAGRADTRGDRSPGDGLGRRPGYVDLVRYFMKAWDARMSLSSLSKCRI